MQLHIIETAWEKLKTCHNTHGNKISWSDLGSKYTVLVDHAPFRYVCTIEKTDPRSSEQIEFEDSYKD